MTQGIEGQDVKPYICESLSEFYDIKAKRVSREQEQDLTEQMSTTDSEIIYMWGKILKFWGKIAYQNHQLTRFHVNVSGRIRDAAINITKHESKQ